MAKISTSITLDADVKAQAQALFADFGMDLSTAINIFLKQSIRDNCIPFVIQRNIPNSETKAAIENIRNGKNLSKEFHSVSELMEDLYADDPI